MMAPDTNGRDQDIILLITHQLEHVGGRVDGIKQGRAGDVRILRRAAEGDEFAGRGDHIDVRYYGGVQRGRLRAGFRRAFRREVGLAGIDGELFGRLGAGRRLAGRHPGTSSEGA